MNDIEVNWLIIVKPYRLSTLGIENLYLSTKGFTSKPTDTPASKTFMPVVADPGNFEVHAFRDGRTFGKSEAAFGEIVLNNEGGSLDELLFDYAFDGRSCEIWRLEMVPRAAFADATIWFTGTVEQADGSWGKVTLRLRDRQDELDIPIETTLFAGTNSGGTGLEGLPNDVKNQPKPNLWGKRRQVPAVPVNTTSYTYQVHNGSVQSISNVRVAGATMTFTSNYANTTLLLAASLSGSQYATCLAAGMMRFGSLPAGVVTADVEGDNSGSYVSSVADIIERIVTTRGGLVSGDLDAASFTALNSANSAVTGIYVKSGDTIRNVIDILCNDVGAFWYFSRAGKLTLQRVENPALGTPVLTLTDVDLIEQSDDPIQKLATNDPGQGIPNYQVTVLCQPVTYDFSDGDIVASVSLPDRLYLTTKYRRSSPSGAIDATIRNKWLTSQPLEVPTNFDSLSDGDTEAVRRFDIYSTLHQRYQMWVDTSKVVSIELGAILELDIDRFNLSGGKNGLLIGKTDELAAGQSLLEVWV